MTFTVGLIANATGYTWSIPTGATIVSGNNANSIVVDLSPNAVSGPITVFGTNNCNKGASSPAFNLTINPIPPAPVVTADGTSIGSSAFQGNRWFFSSTKNGNGSEVQGVVSRVYNPTQNGWYWSVVTLNGCTSSPSDRIFRLKSGENYRYNIYPVPNKGEFAITITTSDQEEFTIQVFDQLGQKIYEISGLEINGEFNHVISLNSPPTGIYTVVLRSNTGDVFTRKISILK